MPRTFDFTTMYTKLNHGKIKNNVMKACKEGLLFQNSRIHESEEKTRDRTEMGKVLCDIKKLLEFVVDNTYIANDINHILHQICGLPMGTNAAPYIANLTLYWDEALYIDNLVTNDNLNLAKKHLHTRRYIDDIFSMDVTPPSQTIYGIEYKETTKMIGVEFLGAIITQNNSNGYEGIIINVLDKFREWNIDVIKYPHNDSNVSRFQSRAIIIGQLYRFRTICNSITSFKKATTGMVQHMLKRGHSELVIRNGWQEHLNRFSNDRLTNYRTLNAWFRKMITWAYYHPNDRSDNMRPNTQIHQGNHQQVDTLSEAVDILSEPQEDQLIPDQVRNNIERLLARERGEEYKMDTPMEESHTEYSQRQTPLCNAINSLNITPYHPIQNNTPSAPRAYLLQLTDTVEEVNNVNTDDNNSTSQINGNMMDQFNAVADRPRNLPNRRCRRNLLNISRTAQRNKSY